MILRTALSASLLSLGLALAALPVATGTAMASDKDKRFFSTVEGNWSGPGEIVAGKYKGTRFTCTFKGATPDGKLGMSLDGGCRVGLFTQKMSATVEHNGRKGYGGSFMDGAKGEGLDVVGGSVNGRKVTLTLHRNQLNGAMLANMPDDDTMHVTVSVKVASKMVPVIGMNLKRTDTRTAGVLGN